MSAYNNDKSQNMPSMTGKNNQALQSALDDAENTLAIDPLQDRSRSAKENRTAI